MPPKIVHAIACRVLARQDEVADDHAHRSGTATMDFAAESGQLSTLGYRALSEIASVGRGADPFQRPDRPQVTSLVGAVDRPLYEMASPSAILLTWPIPT